MKRKIVRIDELKCNGCGQCVASCHEGAIRIIAGKARLAADSLCDGLGACLGECPQGAIMLEEREADVFVAPLKQWPVQLKLVNPQASFFKDADLIVSADCAAFSYGDFHRRFLAGKVLLIFCPKLDDDGGMYAAKLGEIFRWHHIRSVTVVRMEVPCCGGTLRIVEEALRFSGKSIAVRAYTISLQGEIIS